MLTYPTRRYPGTVLVFPLSFTSLTTMSAVPRGISFTHMRFFLDTEASGSAGRESEGSGAPEREHQKMLTSTA